jgi:hypothetical protein
MGYRSPTISLLLLQKSAAGARRYKFPCLLNRVTLTHSKGTLPLPVASQPCQPSLPTIDPRLGNPPPHSLSTSSHEATVWHPSETIPSPAVSQHSLPNIDPHLGFYFQHARATASHQVGLQHSSETAAPTRSLPTRSLPVPAPSPIATPLLTPAPYLDAVPSFTHVPSAPLPQAITGSNLVESESEDGDSDNPQNQELDVDEHSEDEDDRNAHQLLRAAAPAVSQAVTEDPPVLSHDYQGYSVSLHPHSQPHLTLLPLAGIWW